MKNKRQIKMGLMLCFLAATFVGLVEIYAAQTRRQMVRKSVDPDVAMRKWMLEISRELGVTCTHCHNTKDFKDNSKDEYKVALNHIKIVEWLEKDGFYKDRRNTQVSCFMCHRGQPVPDYKMKPGIGH